MNCKYPRIYVGTDFHTVKICRFPSGVSTSYFSDASVDWIDIQRSSKEKKNNEQK